MRRVLLVTSDFPPHYSGGIQRYYYDWARYSDGALDVLATSSGECQEFDKAQPFTIYRVPTPHSKRAIARFLQGLILNIASLALSLVRKYDVIVYGHWYLNIFGPLLLSPFGRSYWTVLHGGELSPYEKAGWMLRAYAYILRKGAGVIVNSEFTKAHFTRMGIAHSNTVTITPRVDLQRFTLADGEAVRTQHGLCGRTVLLTVGTLVERKGHDMVLRSLPGVLATDPGVHYVIVGTGPYGAELRRLAIELNLQAHVTFAGRVSDTDLPNYYDMCDVFVMPSRLLGGTSTGVEGFGIVYLEAAALRKPVIGGRGAGAEEAIADGVSGLLVDPLSVEDISTAIRGLLGHAETAKLLGTRGRLRVMQEFAAADGARTLLATVFRNR